MISTSTLHRGRIMAIRVTVKAISEISRVLGWEQKEVEFEGSTMESLLKTLVTLDGKSLYSYIVEQGGLKGGYIVSVNGHVIPSLDTQLNPGDHVMTMEMVRLFHGG
jgi:sulfur carrier protein ThiS